MARLFNLTENGKVVLYNRKTKKAAEYWPIDAKEILTSSDDYSLKPIVDPATGAVPIEIDNSNQETDTRPELGKLKKPELLDYAKTIGLDLEIKLTIDEITQKIEEKWEAQDL